MLYLIVIPQDLMQLFPYQVDWRKWFGYLLSFSLARSSSHKIQETVTPWSRSLFICVYCNSAIHMFSFSVSYQIWIHLSTQGRRLHWKRYVRQGLTTSHCQSHLSTQLHLTNRHNQGSWCQKHLSKIWVCVCWCCFGFNQWKVCKYKRTL